MSSLRELPMRPTWADIDLPAFDRNVDAIAAGLPDGSRLIAVLKANAYGHGAVELAKRCTPDRVAMIAVALLEEAIELRTAGIELPILVLGPLNAAQVEMAIESNVTMGVPGPEQLELVARAAQERDVSIHLKLDSGMGRMGVVESELPRVAAILEAAPRLRVEAAGDERSLDASAPDELPAHAIDLRADRPTVHLDVDGRSIAFALAQPPTVESAVRHAQRGTSGTRAIVAPMPGRVIAVPAREGAVVEEHEPLVVLEAMKMENAVTATAPGTVGTVRARVGQQVQKGDLLVELE